MQSLGTAADCLARKAYWLGHELDYLSPFQKAGRSAFENGTLHRDDKALGQYDPEGDWMYHQRHWTEPNMQIPGRGGKEDDITVTVAQIFHT